MASLAGLVLGGEAVYGVVSGAASDVPAVAVVNWRLAGGLVAIVVFVLLLMGFIRDPFGWRKAAWDRLTTRAVVAEQTAEVATATVKVIERYHTETKIIREIVEKEADALQSLPGADTPLDPVRRDALCATLSRMRDGSPACDDLDSASAPRTVRESHRGEPPD